MRCVVSFFAKQKLIIPEPNAKKSTFMSKTLTSIALSLCLIQTGVSHAFSLSDAIGAARKHHPSIKGGEEALAKSKAEKIGGVSEFLPSLEYQYNTRQTTEYQGIAQYSGNNSIKLSMPLFSGGTSMIRNEIRGHEVHKAKHLLQYSKDSVVFGTVDVYQIVRTYRAIHQIKAELVKNREELLHSTQIMYKMGMATLSDVAAIEARLASDQAQEAEAKAKVSTAEASFEEITGIKPPVGMEPIPMHFSHPTLEALVSDAIRNNHELLSYKQSYEGKKKAVALQYSTMLPTVQAEASFDENRGHNPYGGRNMSPHGRTYLLMVRAPIFSGGRNIASVKAAIHDRDAAKHDIKQREATLKKKVVEAWNNVISGKVSIDANLKAIKAAEKALEGTIEEAKAGTKNTLHVLDAQDDLFRAKEKHRVAEYHYVSNMYSIYVLTGRIDQISH